MSVRSVRRWAMTLLVVAVGGYAAINPGAVKAFYQGIYPSDPVKRQALELCFMQNHKFNRLEASEREACYHRMLQPLGEIPGAGAGAEQLNTNLVDLQHAAGAGAMPRNDIRRLEQTENAPHSPQ